MKFRLGFKEPIFSNKCHQQFVRVHQELLNILIGKAGLITSVPLVGPPRRRCPPPGRERCRYYCPHPYRPR